MSPVVVINNCNKNKSTCFLRLSAVIILIGHWVFSIIDFTLFTLHTPTILMYFNVKCGDLQLTVFSFRICLYFFSCPEDDPNQGSKIFAVNKFVREFLCYKTN